MSLFFPKTPSVADDIAYNMHKQLIKDAVDNETLLENKIVQAAELISKAAEILDEVGLSKQAEVSVAVLESLAGKGKKKKKKSAPKKLKEPTSEQMVENYKEKGWAFNEANDQNSANDRMKDHNCAACGSPLKQDMNKADEPHSFRGDPGWHNDEIKKLRDEQSDDYFGTDDDFEDEWDLQLTKRHPDQLSYEDMHPDVMGDDEYLSDTAAENAGYDDTKRNIINDWRAFNEANYEEGNDLTERDFINRMKRKFKV